MTDQEKIRLGELVDKIDEHRCLDCLSARERREYDELTESWEWEHLRPLAKGCYWGY